MFFELVIVANRGAEAVTRTDCQVLVPYVVQMDAKLRLRGVASQQLAVLY